MMITSPQNGHSLMLEDQMSPEDHLTLTILFCRLVAWNSDDASIEHWASPAPGNPNTAQADTDDIVCQIFTANQPVPSMTQAYNPNSSQVVATFGAMQYNETMVAGTPNNFATTYSFYQKWPIKYEWAKNGERGLLIATPYLGITFNTSATGTQNMANFKFTIDQVEIDYEEWELLKAAQGAIGA